MKKFLLPLVLLLGGLAFGQASRQDGTVTGPNGAPVHMPTIKVCTATSTPGVVGTSTTCATPATLFSDHLADNCNGVACPNPFTGDFGGNYHFYAAAGRVILDVISNGILQSETIDDIVPCEQGVTCGGAATLTGGVNTFLTIWTGPSTVAASGLQEVSNTFSTTDTVDFSAAALFKVPSGAGLASTTAGAFTFDTTANRPKIGTGSSTLTVLTTADLGTSFVQTTASATFGNFVYDFSGVKEFRPMSGTTAAKPATCSNNPMDVYLANDATAGQNWYFCTSLNTWTQQLNTGGGGGAGTNLGNLAAVAFNVALTPNSGNLGTANADLGSVSTPINSIYIGTAATNNVQVKAPTVTASRNATLPDNTGTIAETNFAQSWSATQSFSAIQSTTANPSATGFLRFANGDAAKFRNNTNNADLNALSFDTSNFALLGDASGVKIQTLLSTQAAGTALLVQPLAATGNNNGGDLTLQGGNGAGTGVNGYIHLFPGTGGSGGNGYIDIGTSAMTQSYTNDSSGPTAQFLLVAYTSTGTVTSAPAAATVGVLGICESTTCATAGATVKVAFQGIAPCTFDNTATPGDVVVPSSTTAGQCHDAGTTAPASIEVVGAVSSLVSAGLYNVSLAIGGGGGAALPANAVITNPAGTQTVQPTIASATGLSLKCPTGAASTLNCFSVFDSNNNALLLVKQNGTIQFGNGTSGSLQATSIISAASNPSTVGFLEMAGPDKICWRNNANGGNLCLYHNISDSLVTDMSSLTINTANQTIVSFANPAAARTLTVADAGGNDTFAYLAAAQTFTNKTIGDALTFTEVATPSNPASGFQLIYAGTDHNAHCLTSTGGNCFPSGGGGSGTVNSGTGGQITWYAANGTTVSGNSNFTIASNIMKAAAGGFDTTGVSAVMEECIADTAGTTAALLVKLTTTSGTKCVTATTSDVGALEGIAVTGGAAGTTTQVAYAGVASCTFDNTTVINDIVVASTTTAGDCHDAGSNIPAGAQPIGKALAVNGGVGTAANVMLFGKEQLAIQGTSTQVLTSFANGVLTLSLPQNIGTGSNVQFSSVAAATFKSSASNGNVTLQVPQNGASNITGVVTVQGGDMTGTGNLNAGAVLIRGGNDATTGTTGLAGNVDIQGGQATAATGTGQQQGHLTFEPIYYKGATYTVGNAQCFSANNTVSDCGTSATNFVGVAVTSNGNAAIVAHDGNQVSVNYDATVSPSAGWFICTSATTAGKFTAQSAACAAGRTAGIIEASGTNVTSGATTLVHF